MDAFISSRDFDQVDQVKRRILNLYRDDIRKHAGREELKVEAIYDELPSQLKNQNRHFKLSSLKQGARFDEYKDALFWLSDAMIVNNCYNSTEPNIGLNLNRDRTLLKCYMGDTGLLVSHAFDENGIVSGEIYKKLLLDFLTAKSKISSRHNISPIEVKSGKNYTLSSIKKFQEKYGEQLHIPYVLHTEDLKEEDRILYLPVYMTPFL